MRFSARPSAIITALACATLAAPGHAQAGRASDAAVMAVIQGFAHARDHFDAKALDALLAPDYVEVSPRGDIDSRSAVLGFYAADKAVPIPSVTAATQDMRVYADTAIVIGSMTFALPAPGGGTVTRTLRITYVERLIAGQWKMASVQYTGVQPPKPAP